jgi:hypothetical protein
MNYFEEKKEPNFRIGRYTEKNKQKLINKNMIE